MTWDALLKVSYVFTVLVGLVMTVVMNGIKGSNEPWAFMFVVPMLFLTITRVILDSE